MIDVTAWAPPRHANEGVYGPGRRPSRKDLTGPDPAAIAEWQARQDAAHDEYDVCPSIAERYIHNARGAE